MKSQSSNEYISEDEKDHFNFEILKIGEEWRKTCTPWIDAAEVPEVGTQAEKE